MEKAHAVGVFSCSSSERARPGDGKASATVGIQENDENRDPRHHGPRSELTFQRRAYCEDVLTDLNRVNRLK